MLPCDLLIYIVIILLYGKWKCIWIYILKSLKKNKDSSTKSAFRNYLLVLKPDYKPTNDAIINTTVTITFSGGSTAGILFYCNTVGQYFLQGDKYFLFH